MRKLGVLALLTALPFVIVAAGRPVDFDLEDDAVRVLSS